MITKPYLWTIVEMALRDKACDPKQFQATTHRSCIVPSIQSELVYREVRLGHLLFKITKNDQAFFFISWYTSIPVTISYELLIGALTAHLYK
jgi:hypothetical protein